MHKSCCEDYMIIISEKCLHRAWHVQGTQQMLALIIIAGAASVSFHAPMG